MTETDDPKKLPIRNELCLKLANLIIDHNAECMREWNANFQLNVLENLTVALFLRGHLMGIVKSCETQLGIKVEKKEGVAENKPPQLTIIKGPHG